MLSDECNADHHLDCLDGENGFCDCTCHPWPPIQNPEQQEP